jgi:hypothetical protein
MVRHGHTILAGFNSPSVTRRSTYTPAPLNCTPKICASFCTSYLHLSPPLGASAGGTESNTRGMVSRYLYDRLWDALTASVRNQCERCCSRITKWAAGRLWCLAAAVGQNVGHIVPVDPWSLLLIPHVLLRQSADKVPVTGTQRGNPSCPWAPFKSLNIADCPKEIRVSRGFLPLERPDLLQDATVSEPAIAENKGLYGRLSK